MDKMLGEVVLACEVQSGELVWLDKEYKAIRTVEHIENGHVMLTTVDGYTEVLKSGDNVIRGWRFLVARRVN